MDRSWVREPLFLLLSLVFLGFAAEPTEAQEAGSKPAHVGVGLFLPQTDLPAVSTVWGQAQGRFIRGLTAWTDLSSRPALLGIQLYGQLSVSFTSVSWHTAGNAVGGSVVSGTLGLKRTIQLGSRLAAYLKTGAGTYFYLLSAENPCVPEDAACVTSHSYVGNDFDPAFHVAVGVEVMVRNRSFDVELSDARSRFSAANNRAMQRYIMLLVGVGVS